MAEDDLIRWDHDILFHIPINQKPDHCAWIIFDNCDVDVITFMSDGRHMNHEPLIFEQNTILW